MSHPSVGAKVTGIDGWLVLAQDPDGQQWSMNTEGWPEWDSPSEAVSERRVMEAAGDYLHINGRTLFGGHWERVQA